MLMFIETNRKSRWLEKKLRTLHFSMDVKSGRKQGTKLMVHKDITKNKVVLFFFNVKYNP